MAEESKYTAKSDCFHYANGKCKILTSTIKGELNCELCNCTFYETAAEYRGRQNKFKERIIAEMQKAGISCKLIKNLEL